MRKNGQIFCDHPQCNLRIAPQDPDQVQSMGRDFHRACWKKMFVITIIQARWKEATNGEHKARDLLFLSDFFGIRRLVEAGHLQMSGVHPR